MSFGRWPHTGLMFDEKFSACYESLPAPSPITAAVQAQRARELEAAGSCDGPRPCTSQHRYLFVMINDFDRRGGFHACPGDVQRDVFAAPYYPAQFRWFVIDPTQREEVRFLAEQIEEFWHVLETATTRQEWWYTALATARAKLRDE